MESTIKAICGFRSIRINTWKKDLTFNIMGQVQLMLLESLSISLFERCNQRKQLICTPKQTIKYFFSSASDHHQRLCTSACFLNGCFSCSCEPAGKNIISTRNNSHYLTNTVSASKQRNY